MSFSYGKSTAIQLGAVTTLTGNSGGAVSPTAGNINIVGTGGVSVVDTPGTSTLTISAAGSVATTYNEDSGSATPALNVLNIVGGTGIVTSGAGSTVTISATGTTTLSYKLVVNGTSPYTVLAADDYISCDLSGGAITIKLPDAPATGRVFVIKDKVGLANISNITVTTSSGLKTIDGSTSYTMNTAREAINVIYNSTNYEVY